MASFGSSVINKSGKKFAPKNRRRPGVAAVAAASEATSTASSTDQTPASTPAAADAAPTDSQDVLPTPPATQAPSQSEDQTPAPKKPVSKTSAQSEARSTISEPPATNTPTESVSSSIPEPTTTQSRETFDPSTTETTNQGVTQVDEPTTTTDALPAATAPEISSQLPTEYTEAVHNDAERSPKRRKIGIPKMVGMGSLGRSSAFRAGPSTTPSKGPEQGILSSAPTPQATTSSTNIFSPPDVQSLRDPGSRSPVKENAQRQSTPTAPRGTHKDLIQRILGNRAGVTKPSIKPSPSRQFLAVNQESGSAGSDASNIDQAQDSPTTESDAPAAREPARSKPAKVTKRGPKPAAKRRTRNIPSPEYVDEATGQSGTEATQEAETSTNEATSASSSKKPRKPRKDKGTSRAKQAEKTTEESGDGAMVPVPRPKRQRKKPAVLSGPRIVEITDDQETNGVWVQDSNNGELVPTWRFELQDHLVYDKEEPENPEKTRINPASMPMSILTKDLPDVGKPSVREDALSKIDWDEEKRKRIEERERIALGEEEINTQAERDEAARKIQEAANEANSSEANPRMRLVNGRLVLDSTSTQVDRHARAHEDENELLEIEENELTTRVNSMSWIRSNRKDPRERTSWGGTRADRWTEEMTEQFYEALKMFGTDFFIISKMFPGKTRANVKRKFVKEEHMNPDRIKRALIGEVVPMNFETFKEKSGKDDEYFRDPEELKRELAEEEEKQRVEIEEAAARHAEQQRQRALAEGQNGEGEEGEGGKKKKKREKKKPQAPIGGDDIEIVEMDGDELNHR
ncbi:hypothetical protein HDK64DRAFT_71662 [Phyllosticta capitalensis]